MQIDNIPIIGKLLMILGVFAVLIVGSTAFVTSKMRAIDDAYSALSENQAFSGIMLSRSNTAMRAMRGAIAELLIANTEAGNQRALQDLAAERDKFVRFIDAAAKAASAHGEEYSNLKRDVLNVVDQHCAPTIKVGSSSSSSTEILNSQAMFLADCAPLFPPIAEIYGKALETNLAEAKVVNDATNDVTDATIRTTWVLMIGGLFLATVGAYLATRAWISGPLTRLAAVMSRVAGGDYEVAVTGADRKDEVGTIARVAQVFKDAGREKLRLEDDAVRHRQAADDERQRNDTARAASLQEQARVVQAIASGLERLSNGSLVFRIDEAFAAEYDKLRTDFNGAMNKLQETMTVVSANTSTIRSGTDEISTAADDLSKRTEQQAASLEETSAALDEITATVRKTAEGASHARSVVGRAKQDAEQSGDVVRLAVDAMSSIEKSSQQIGQIIGVIDEIAFQTNLLALNAGVEAARAGEAGRGFAVVASEVRALAQRSAEAAKEIKALISASTAQVEQGVDLVGQTGKVLERIVGQVNEINTIVIDIAASAQEQATGLNQINTAINQMDQVTQQNAAMVEESTAASRNLSQETEQLAHLIGRFDVGGNAAASRAAPARRSVKPGVPVRSAAPVQALKTVGSGGAARKPESAADQDWQEF